MKIGNYQKTVGEDDGEKTVVVLDFGSQYTQLILRRVRNLVFMQNYSLTTNPGRTSKSFLQVRLFSQEVPQAFMMRTHLRYLPTFLKATCQFLESATGSKPLCINSEEG